MTKLFLVFHSIWKALKDNTTATLLPCCCWHWTYIRPYSTSLCWLCISILLPLQDILAPPITVIAISCEKAWVLEWMLSYECFRLALHAWTGKSIVVIPSNLLETVLYWWSDSCCVLDDKLRHQRVYMLTGRWCHMWLRGANDLEKEQNTWRRGKETVRNVGSGSVCFSQRAGLERWSTSHFLPAFPLLTQRAYSSHTDPLRGGVLTQMHNEQGLVEQGVSCDLDCCVNRNTVVWKNAWTSLWTVLIALLLVRVIRLSWC